MATTVASQPFSMTVADSVDNPHAAQGRFHILFWKNITEHYKANTSLSWEVIKILSRAREAESPLKAAAQVPRRGTPQDPLDR